MDFVQHIAVIQSWSATHALHLLLAGHGLFVVPFAIIPAEMIFASASGLDPHISPEAALLQVERISTARKYTDAQKQQVLQLIENHTEGPRFSLLGERRINVFALNLNLDNIR